MNVMSVLASFRMNDPCRVNTRLYLLSFCLLVIEEEVVDVALQSNDVDRTGGVSVVLSRHS